MNIITKIKNCLIEKMTRQSVPKSIAIKTADWYTEHHVDDGEAIAIEAKKMHINYHNLEFQKVMVDEQA